MAYEQKPGKGSAWPKEPQYIKEDWHATHGGKLMLPPDAVPNQVRYVDVTVRVSRDEKTGEEQTWYQLNIGKPVGAPQAVYSAAHQPFVKPTPSPSAPSKLDDPDQDIPF